MIKSVRDIAPYLTDEKLAGEFIQNLRWPDGVVSCPLCEKDGGGLAPAFDCDSNMLYKNGVPGRS